MEELQKINPLKKLLILYGFAIGGGVFATIAAIFKELFYSYLLILVPIFIAPLIEELLKPVGVFHLLNRYPKLLSSRAQVVWLGMLSAFTFSALENLLYLYVYYPNHTTELVAIRWLVCTPLHMLWTAILVYGASAQLKELQSGDDETFFDLEKAMGWVVAAIAFHALYNTAVILLSSSGRRAW